MVFLVGMQFEQAFRPQKVSSNYLNVLRLFTPFFTHVSNSVAVAITLDCPMWWM